MLALRDLLDTYYVDHSVFYYHSEIVSLSIIVMPQ